ncbi:hypothetical protein [Paenilisteria rocourtiae]|uniref:Uncharacterized protein n=1 Tax=Listeria rocourtiae TaxID=647910 RepID=A0A4R6ZHT0_9LIST|nr:hypothetical protein [Listeria rocourtiae]TDR51715.1 hypothetical protein DFP96_11121 [Listeria rocourtiae]
MSNSTMIDVLMSITVVQMFLVLILIAKPLWEEVYKIIRRIFGRG